eukprot:TRINITY_DN13758_c0_g1_i5.p1 TRINITY_DN13758_c0_g1~~TRINITY_DN13758_c0_g1_i5.p1  ORF type:complete len:221 (-),score=50.93 TRINITY_DN13758_c0_g1_i5:596-1258(-)
MYIRPRRSLCPSFERKRNFSTPTAFKSKLSTTLRNRIDADYNKYYNWKRELETSPSVTRMKELGKSCSKLAPLVENVEAWKAAVTAQLDAFRMIEDPNCDKELLMLAKEEFEEWSSKVTKFEDEIISYFLPKDENDEGSAIVELRPGPGGLEASLWAMDMYNIYQNYASSQGWSFTSMSYSTTEMGGLRIGGSLCNNRKFSVCLHEVGEWRTSSSEGPCH